MPRLPRIYLENCLYYITLQSNHGEVIFKDDEDYKMYLEILKKYKEQYGFKLFSFVLMPQQLNLLMETKEGATVSAIMHDINSSYTKYFNNRNKRKGHLFQQRFKSVIVEKEPYLLNLISHMHYTPLKSGLVKTLNEYAYSSHLIYLYTAGDKSENAQNIQKILSLEKEAAEAIRVIAETYPNKKDYADFINSVTDEEIESFKKKMHRVGILGSEQFVNKVKLEMEEKAKIEEPKEFPLVPVAAVIIVVMLAGVGIGIFYVQKQVALREKQIYERLRKQEVVDTQALSQKEKEIYERLRKNFENQIRITKLDGTEWVVEIKPEANNPDAPVSVDDIKFQSGKVSSKNLSAKGFSPSNYTLTFQKDGTIVWETMQSSPNTTASWRGEINNEKMQGVLSLHSSDGKAQDFYFTSVNYRR